MGELTTRTANIKLEFDPDVATKIVDGIADGKTMGEIIAANPDFPSRRTIYRWLSLMPAFKVAYDVAHTTSATTYEEMALEIAKRLEDEVLAAPKVTALNYAMQQYRWSAERRDPAKYAAKTNAAVVVPIEIITTLNLGREGQEKGSDVSIYELAATMVEEVDKPSIENAVMVDEVQPEKSAFPTRKTVRRTEPKPKEPVVGLQKQRAGMPLLRRKSPGAIKGQITKAAARKTNGE